jgi:hypothetical protein
MKGIIVSFFVLFSWLVLADSPLTSTNFAEAYKQEKIVNYALKQNGKINRKLVRYIASQRAPLELKLACINALSWHIDGHSNAPILLKTLLKKNKCLTRDELIQRGKSTDLLCYAYLLSLDNYHDVEMAKIMAQHAADEHPTSYAFQLINALITAQYLFEGDWCEVYKTCDNVRSNPLLQEDFSKRAKEIVFEYMDLYSTYCE